MTDNTPEYKHTLNLPYTAFPMKASLPQREPEMLNQWSNADLYQKIRAVRKGAPRFILHDGPPYANGHLHCGHALNKILKDIIIKSKTMSGFDAPFVPGWDCHGLPIELNVEKKIDKTLKENPREFRQACRKYAVSQVEIQKSEFQRLGVFAEWDKPYVTMDYTYEANTVRALAEIIARGHLHQGFKPVHWCLNCQSALAEAEVDYEDKTSPSIDVAFAVVNPKACIAIFANDLTLKPVEVPIWTTTPWTLPANEAVSVHPELEYVLVDVGTKYLLLAEGLCESSLQRYPFDTHQIVGKVQGMALEHTSLQHPFEARSVPLVLSTHVTLESGTGCVHTAPAHGPDDYQVGTKYQLPLRNPVLSNGCYAEDIPYVGGMYVTKAETPIITLLKERDRLLSKTTVVHSYPHCWRHKTPIIFRATPQWFISMEQGGLRKHLQSSLDKITFLPEWGQARIRLMIENRPDWCISRQRAWGTPIPLFVHRQTRELHPESVAIMHNVAKRIEKTGIDAWFDVSSEELIGNDATEYEKITDTLDVWFDSGVSHYCVLSNEEGIGFPADVYIEGSDQYRGWFNSSLTTSIAINGVPPYKTVLTHGYTVDAEGKKLSKSKGNYVELEQMIQKHGADVLRLWVASTDYRHEVSISDEIIKRNSDAYRRIRNTARFLLSNLFDFSKDQLLPMKQCVELDQWLIAHTQILQNQIFKAYEEYQFHVVYQLIAHFCSIDLGSFYLDVIKDRQYTTPKESLPRRSCQTAMYYVLQALTRWIAPILSFTAEEIWQAIPSQTQAESIFLQSWFQDWPSPLNVNDDKWQVIQTVRDEVNKALEIKRQAGEIGSGLAADLIIYANQVLYPSLQSLEEELRFVFITSSAQLEPYSAKPKDLVGNDVLGLAVAVSSSQQSKCVRCWHRDASVGQHITHTMLCERCVGNISGQPEVRKFV